MTAAGVEDHGAGAQLQQLRNKLIFKKKKTTTMKQQLWGWGEGNMTSPFQHLPALVHERHGALWLVTKNPREKLQRQAHVDGHKDVGGVDHHGDGGEEEGVEDGLLPGLQHIDAGDEQVLVVKPGQVLPEAFEAHLLPRMKAGGEEGEEEGQITALDD